MKNNYYICNLNTLKNKGYFIKWIEEWKDELIAILNEDGELKIFSSICPHFGGEIYFDKKLNVLKCKWHAWSFCSKSGKCLNLPIKLSLKSYDVMVVPGNTNSYTVQLTEKNIYAIRDE